MALFVAITQRRSCEPEKLIDLYFKEKALSYLLLQLEVQQQGIHMKEICLSF
jgi:hypothetical protein